MSKKTSVVWGAVSVLLPVVIGTLAGPIAEDWWAGRVLALVLKTHTEEVLERDLAPNGLDLRVGDHSIAGIGVTWVEFYNSSSKDYEDVDVFVHLNPSGSVPIEILSHTFEGPHGLDSTVEYLGREAPHRAGGARFGYTLRAAQRSDQPILSATYVYATDLHVNVGARTTEPNLRIEYWVDSQAKRARRAATALWSVGVAVVLSLLVLAVRFGMRRSGLSN